jgi:LPXTG-site transpeptidase (sortase) family protein
MPQNFYSVGTTLFFSATDGESGVELWKTNPPYTEAELVADIRKGPDGSNPNRFQAVGTTLFFTASDGVYGEELWRSELPYDEQTTQIVGDIRRGAGGSNPQELTAINRTLIFRADDGSHGSELWKMGGEYSMLPSTGFAPGRVTQLPDKGIEYSSSQNMRLVVPVLQLNIPLEGIPQSAGGWDLTWLGNQAGYLEGTAFPTLPGNTAITAHAYLADGNPGPFHDLEQIRWGDTIGLEAWGNRYIYEVRRVETVDPLDLSILGSEELDWITLITCKGYDETLEDYRWRVVVKAVLIRVESLED